MDTRNTEDINMVHMDPGGIGAQTREGDIRVDVPEDGHTDMELRPNGGMNAHYTRESMLQRMPSHKASVKMGMSMDTLRRKSRKKRRHGGTVRFKHGEMDTTDFVDEFLSDPALADAPQEEINDEIRALTTTLSNKRAVRDRLEIQQKGTTKDKQSWWNKTSMASRQLKYNFAEVTYATDLWREHLRTIEGHFGTGVTSYFVFLKYLFLINIPVFILTFGFLTVPQILYRWLQQEPPGFDEELTFSGTDLLTGGGWLNQTELYYGAYLNGTIEISKGHQYDMQYAYLSTCIGYYLLTTILLGKRLMQSYRRNYIHSSDNFQFYYVAKVFCGWDFSIYETRAAELRHMGIFKEYQEYLYGFRKVEEVRTCAQSCGMFLLRLLINLLIVGLLAGSGYLVWYISVTQSLSNTLNLLSDLALPLCISAINFILPFGFSILGAFERYKNPRVEIYLTMIRTILLHVVTLGVLIYFWFNTVNCALRDENDSRWLDNEMPCQACWENFMGQQIYMLVIVDFLFILVITLLSEFVRRLMSQYCCKNLANPEFNIGRNTLNLIYSQALVWLGMFYSPLLSLIAIIKLFILFYVKRVSVVQNCMPSVKPWRAGQTTTLILGLLFASLLMAFFVVAWSVAFLEPSQVCGPYQGKNRTYDVFNELLDNWNDSGIDWLRFIVEVITSTAFLGFVCVALVVAAYYCQVIAKGHKEMVELLRRQIALEGKDKQFLLKLLQEASRKLGPVTQVSSRPDYSKQPSESGSGSGSNAPNAATPRAGRQYSKIASEEGSIRHRDSPRLERASQQARLQADSHVRQRNPPKPHEHYNASYKDQSMAREAGAGNTGSHVVGYHDQKNLDPQHVQNAAYQDTSLTSKPNLPYPGQPYDMYSGNPKI